MAAPIQGFASPKQRRIAELARRRPREALTTLSHHIDIEFLTEAYRQTRKDGAVGVDGQTAEAYAENLEENLQALLNRFKSGLREAGNGQECLEGVVYNHRRVQPRIEPSHATRSSRRGKGHTKHGA